MELNEATRKRARASTSSPADDPDRLSALSDCLLHTIMSFMKARQVVQTCLLSSRWRHLWRSVPCLDVDLDEFTEAAVPALLDDEEEEEEEEEEEDEGEEHDDNEWERFEDFAVYLMLHRNIAMLDSFRLSLGKGCLPCCSDSKAGGWIRRAMKYCTPEPVVHREGLGSISWRLKRLHLGHVLLDDGFAKHVSSMCHSLEDLELVFCTCEIRSITSRSLKNLVLERCRLYQLSEISSPTLKKLVIDGGSNTQAQLVISAPAVALLDLSVSDHEFCAGVSVNEMPSLAKASICLWGFKLESKLVRDQPKLLFSVSNATSLELYGLKPMVLDEESTTAFQEFKNLRSLLLNRCYLTDNFHTLGLFLQNAPYLEKLTLRDCKVPVDTKKKEGTPRAKDTSSSKCRSLDVKCGNLKLTEIIYGDDDVCRMQVEFLIRISGKLPKN